MTWLPCPSLIAGQHEPFFVCSSSLTVSEFHLHILITFEDVNVVFLKINHHKNLLQKKENILQRMYLGFQDLFSVKWTRSIY